MRARALAAAALLLPLAPAPPAPAEADPPAAVSSAPPVLLPDALPEDAALGGREIYERVLRNRFDAYVQVSALVSGDRGGAEQESRLRMMWRSFRDQSDAPVRGVLSKTLVRYTDPFDLRSSGYLIVSNHERPSDQFVYLASARRIRRVNLRGEAIFGTDFTFEDVVPREVEDSSYRRLPDERVEEVPCYVVEVTPLPHVDSEYSRFQVYVEKAHYVPLRTRYWDERGLEVKELRADPARIREFDGVWVPMAATMRNLQLETFTSLRVEELVPNPEHLSSADFDLRRLEGH
jgi:hypothetical protein